MPAHSCSPPLLGDTTAQGANEEREMVERSGNLFGTYSGLLRYRGHLVHRLGQCGELLACWATTWEMD